MAFYTGVAQLVEYRSPKPMVGGSSPSSRARDKVPGSFPPAAGRFVTQATSRMNKLKQYIQDSYHELLHKVSWPTWEQLQSSTMVVLIATVIVTLLVWVMDIVSSTVLENFYKLFR